MRKPAKGRGRGKGGITYHDLLCVTYFEVISLGIKRRHAVNVSRRVAEALAHRTPHYRPDWLLCACNRSWVPGAERGYRGHVFDGVCSPKG